MDGWQNGWFESVTLNQSTSILPVVIAHGLGVEEAHLCADPFAFPQFEGFAQFSIFLPVGAVAESAAGIPAYFGAQP